MTDEDRAGMVDVVERQLQMLGGDAVGEGTGLFEALDVDGDVMNFYSTSDLYGKQSQLSQHRAKMTMELSSQTFV
ncbi:hypothetical protein FACS1894116_07240 [Betaproteobacteria bacterium]|nr:hypothetical protein FACS1894116_07240 [Betaproteobacteria bacterium]GHU28013.1 hypothetical protein FACS189497_02430 [Betaproteobacteria bacterium]